MADPDIEIFRQIPEIKTLASIARDLQRVIRLHGSVASALLNVACGQGPSAAHLFDFVPPLSDIDLLAPTPALALQVRAEILRQLPAGNFFHWEVRSPEQLRAYRRWAHVRVFGQPEVLFVPQERHESEADQMGARVVISLGSKDELYVSPARDFSMNQISIEWLDESSLLYESNIDGALRDILYLARLVSLDALKDFEAFQSLRRSLHEAGGSAVARGLLRTPHELRRTIFALVKYLFARAAQSPPSELETVLDERFWRDLALAVRDPVFRELTKRVVLPDKPFKVIVIPRREGARWCRQIVHIQELDSEDNVAKKKFLQKWKDLLDIEETALCDVEVRGQTAGMFLSPVVSLRVAKPPDPGCCLYRDFSRGVAEIAWIEPAPPRKQIRPLSALVSVPEFQELFFAHSYLTVGKASSLRLDYGFLSVLASVRSTVKVIGLGVNRES